MCLTGNALAPQTGRSSNLRSAFDVIDVDHDGKISPDDLRTFYGGRLAGETSEDDVIRSMISVADFNKDGYIEYDEFEKVLESRRNGRSSNILMEEAFRMMDTDGDGMVGHDDLKRCLSWAGFEVSGDEVKAMIRLAGGGDEPYGVTFEALLKVLAV